MTASEKLADQQVAATGTSPWRSEKPPAAADTSVRQVCSTCCASFIATPASGRTAAQNLW